MSKIIYQPLTKGYFFFYTRVPNSNEINFLLYKNKKDGSDILNIISTEINKYDNVCTFGISRILTSIFGNLFIDNTIDKIIKGDNLELEDIAKKERIPQYLIWEEKAYQFWLDKLSKDTIIQYDDIPGEVIYFYEIPYINLQTLNLNLDKLNYFANFTYVNKNDCENYKYSEESLELFKLITIPKMINHIKDSLIIREKDERDSYIVLACKKSGKDQNGFFHFPALFTGLYRKNNEKWAYMIASLELPDEKTLLKTKCIIIPGSELSIYEDVPFLRTTEKFLNQLINDILYNKKYPQLKLLGVCFGMQIFLSSLGGKIEKGNLVERFPVKINLDKSFWDLNFVKESKIERKDYLKICEAHGDYVINYPDKYKFKLFGSSDNCLNEIMVDEQEKIFMLQGHPEYQPYFMAIRAYDWYLSFEKKEPTEENVNDFLKRNENEEHNKNVNYNEWRSLCFTFMKK